MKRLSIDKIVAGITLFFTVLLFLIGLAHADQRFVSPTVNGYDLDYCREWGINCGQPAADAYCRSKGFVRAIDFAVQHNHQRTRVINGGQVCDGGYCDRISEVTCKSRTVVINNPKINGYGLDYCREWGLNCGKPAADAFCQSKGYVEAKHFSIVADGQKTRVINGGQVCDAAHCDRISRVECE